MSNENILPEEEEVALMSLTDEEGNELELELLDSIMYQGAEYLVLVPYGEEEAAEVVILEVVPLSDGTEQYLSVEDEEVLGAVFGIFQERFQDIIQFED